MANAAIVAAAADAKIADLRTRALVDLAGQNSPASYTLDSFEPALPDLPRIIDPGDDTNPSGGAPDKINYATVVDLLVAGDGTTAASLVGDTIGLANVTDCDGAGALIAARCPIGKLPDIIGLGSVTSVALAAPIAYALDEVVPLIDAPKCWGGAAPNYSPTGLTGKGTLIVVVDSGVDVAHRDFVDTRNGNATRFAEIWDQGAAVGVPPAGFAYGARIIKTAIQQDVNSGYASHAIDSLGHGTFVAACAASSGGTGGAYKYVGAAPEATLAAVKLPAFPTSANILDAVRYAKALGASLSLPTVCVLAVSSREGAHDGSSALDVGVAAQAGAGFLIVAPAGNEADTARHARIALPAVGATVAAVQCELGYGQSRPPLTEYLWFQGWIADDAQFTVALQLPDLTQVNAANGVEGTTTHAGIQVRVQNALSTVNGKRKVEIYVTNPDTSVAANLPQGIYQLRAVRTGGASAVGAIDWYVVDAVISQPTYHGVPQFGTLGLTGQLFPDSHVTQASTVTSPGTCAAALCVGSWAHDGHYTDADGYDESWGFTEAIRPYSGQGPLLGSATKLPDVCAPDALIVGALSDELQFTPPTYALDQDLRHISATDPGTYVPDNIPSGTSLAAGLAAGATALYLQKNRTADPAAHKAAFQGFVAAADAQTGVTPNNVWGHGRLRMTKLAASATVRPPGGGDDLPFRRTGAYHASLSSNPALTAVPGSWVLTPPDVTFGARDVVELRVTDASGQVVRAHRDFGSYEQIARWDGRDAAGQPVAPGVYHMRVTVLGVSRIGQVLVR